MTDPTGQFALVTGASRGMGLEFVRQLTAKGMNVFAAARHPERSEGLQAVLAEAPDRVWPVAMDVTDGAQIKHAAVSLSHATNGLHLLVNNAGINSAAMSPEQKNVRLGTLEPAGMLRMFEVNAVAPLMVTQAFLPFLEHAGGRVLHVSSWLGSITGKTRGGNYGYCGSKAALNMLGRTLAHDLADRGVASVLCNPGWVRTDMGGEKAKLSPEDAVAGMLRVAFEVTVENSGQFLDHDGTRHDW